MEIIGNIRKRVCHVKLFKAVLFPTVDREEEAKSDGLHIVPCLKILFKIMEKDFQSTRQEEI